MSFVFSKLVSSRGSGQKRGIHHINLYMPLNYILHLCSKKKKKLHSAPGFPSILHPSTSLNIENDAIQIHIPCNIHFFIFAGAMQKGAFSIATKTGAPVVPMTLMGTGKIMPTGMEGTLNPGSVKIVIHKPIGGSNAQELCNEARKKIADTLNHQG